jgi:enoyl-CoA hydratase/carnithine racemase
MAGYEHVLVERQGPYVTITMNRPQRRNALSLAHLRELTDAFTGVGGSDARGVILAGAGPVFSAGHDFADVRSADLHGVRALLQTCLELCRTIQSIPQVVVARVHGLATAAGCQLVATCDLAVAAESAALAAPGGKGGWFCHTPMVAIARNVGRKRAMELALTGDPVDAHTAYEWGLVNRVAPDGELDKVVLELLDAATRGSAASSGLGKQTMYAQLDRPEEDAYRLALEVMTAASQTAEAREGMDAFLQKRPPVWPA